MIMRYKHLKQHPTIFLKMTGLRLHEFDALIDVVLPQFVQAEHERLQRPNRQRQRGGQLQYSDHAIETLLMLRAVYGLPYRQTIGFAQSIFDLMEAEVKMPDYTLLCKRGANLEVSLGATAGDEAKHLVIDSTGLKIYGEGEWKVRQHGYSKRRTWRKLHIGVNVETQQIEAVVLSEAGLDDPEAGKAMLE